MGLDITAVSKLKPIEIPDHLEQWSDEYYDWEMEQEGSIVNIYTHDAFPEASEGLEDGAYLELGERYGFRAGSYSGYNEWRRLLARAALGMSDEEVWNKVDSGVGYNEIPFGELINFSDADGVIGPVSAEKLYNDFVNLEEDVMAQLDRYYLKFEDFEVDGETYHWFKHKYNDWKEAFRIASDNGAVIFH